MARAASELSKVLSSGSGAVLACEHDLDGVLCAVGCVYLAHAAEKDVAFASNRDIQPRIGERVIDCPLTRDEATAAFARRVFMGYSHAVGVGARQSESRRLDGTQTSLLRHLAHACACDDPNMPQAVGSYLMMGFSMGPVSRDLISDPRVMAVDSLVRYADVECEHARQFVRFSRLADGGFGASFKPRANILPLVGTYFASRMRDERFYVVDPTHHTAILHCKGDGRCTPVSLDRELTGQLASLDTLANDERYVRAMWKRFYDSMELRGRGPRERGYDLRTSWMRNRFWEGLTELDPRSDSFGGTVPPKYSSVSHDGRKELS